MYWYTFNRWPNCRRFDVSAAFVLSAVIGDQQAISSQYYKSSRYAKMLMNEFCQLISLFIGIHTLLLFGKVSKCIPKECNRWNNPLNVFFSRSELWLQCCCSWFLFYDTFQDITSGWICRVFVSNAKTRMEQLDESSHQPWFRRGNFWAMRYCDCSQLTLL